MSSIQTISYNSNDMDLDIAVFYLVPLVLRMFLSRLPIPYPSMPRPCGRWTQ